MSDNWQDRKDIDRLKRFVNEIDNELTLADVDGIREYLEQFYDQSIVDEFVEDLTKLRTDLNTFRTSLEEFSSELTSFETDNTKFAKDLKDLQDALGTVLEDVTALKEGSTEFSELLDSFGVDLEEFVTDLMGLNNDLGVLSTYISAFSGTLQQFDTYLQDNLDPDVYNALNEDMVKLVWAINNVTSKSDTVKTRVDNIVNNDIGDATNYNPALYNPPNTANAPQGIQQWIKWIKYKVGDANSGLVYDINELISKIGSNGATKTGIYKDIADLNGHITTINGLINGDANHVGLYAQISALEQDIKDIYDDSGATPTGSLVNLQNMMTTITGRVDALLKTENGQETGRIPSLETRTGNAETRLTSLDGNNGRIAQLETRTTGAEGRLDAILDTSVTPNTGRIPSLETRTTSAEGRLTSLDGNNGRIVQLETRTTNAETRLTNLDGSNGRIKQLEDRTDSAEGRLSTLDGNNGRIAQLETRTTTAEGAISDIEDEIGSDGSGNTAKSGLYLLIDNISSTLNNISNNIIGSDTTQTPSGSLWAMIRNIRDTKIGNDGSNGSAKTGIYALIDGLQTNISSAQSIMGTNESTTGANTVWGKIRKLLDDIGDAEKEVRGTLSNQAINSTHTLNKLLNVVVGDYTPVFVYDGGNDNLSDMDELLDEFMDYVLDNGSLYYILKNGNDVTFKEWVNDTTVTTSIGNTVGILYDLSSTNVVKGNSNYYKNEPYDIIYEFKTNKFYTIQNNTWTETNNLSDYFKYTRLGGVVSGWVKNTALTGSYELYTNEALQLCILYVTGVSVSGMNDGTVTPKTFTPTEMPNPPLQNIYSNSSSVANNVRLTTDRKLQALQGTGNSMSISTQFMWHY